jgi:hypothetical protein
MTNSGGNTYGDCEFHEYEFSNAPEELYFLKRVNVEEPDEK